MRRCSERLAGDGRHRNAGDGPVQDAGADFGALGNVLADGGPAVDRRRFIVGTAGVALAVFGTTAILSGCSNEAEEEEIVPTELEVAESDVLVTSDFTELDTWSCIAQTGYWELPIGCVGTMDSDELAVFLVPSERRNALMSIALFSISSGVLTTVLADAVSANEGYQIYDVRANDSVIVWVESNFHTDDWRLYLAKVMSSTEIGAPMLLDEGDYNFDPPMLCVSGAQAFWTFMPYEEGNASDSDSYLKSATLGSSAPEIVYTSHGRMITNPEASDGIVTIVPRAETKSARYQMTALRASGGEVLSAQILPSSMKVNNAIYLNGHFVFGIERSYNFGGGIALFGTYTDMGNGKYLRFNRTPMDTPAACGNYLVIKSNKSVVGVDMATRSFFAIDTVGGSESYGDFLLSTGTSKQIVTYTSVPAGDGSGNGKVVVRAFGLI